LRQGASACLVEREGVEAFDFDDPAVAAYPSLKAATGPVASLYFGRPSEQIDVLAVTGTNGKTSTAWWLAQALSRLDASHALTCAVVGTRGQVVPRCRSHGHDDARSGLAASQFRRFVEQGLRACAIRRLPLAWPSVVSTDAHQGGDLLPTSPTTISTHGSMAAYWLAKAELFAWPGLQAAVNSTWTIPRASIVRALAGTGVDLWTVSGVPPACGPAMWATTRRD
jgi:UDP-N-acetylmuramoyl-L-alanyl-D-glutamate--2,6-diaminopimelate ligase